MNMVKLTIIIPHFNSVKTLEKLIKSIPARRDVQVIVVDDQSEHHPQKFLPQEMLNRITLLENTSNKKGAGVCRNIGLHNALGSWILFADADDWFVDGFYGVVSEYFDSDFEVVFFTATSMDKDTGYLADRHVHIGKVIQTFLEDGDKKAELDLRYKIPVPWAKLINARFIRQHQITFDEVIASNDIMFSTKVGFHMQNFSASRAVIYCVTRSRENLTVQSNEKNFDARLQVFIERYQYLEQRLDVESFNLLRLHGWFMVFYSLRCGLGIKKAHQAYRMLKKNGVKMWDYRYFNPFILIKRLSNHYLKHQTTRKYFHNRTDGNSEN
jgi:glycosyltransferase involved in cell wall biosynthesis